MSASGTTVAGSPQSPSATDAMPYLTQLLVLALLGGLVGCVMLAF